MLLRESSSVKRPRLVEALPPPPAPKEPIGCVPVSLYLLPPRGVHRRNLECAATKTRARLYFYALC
eukprot:1178447-Prorocentrum_minimum.AAC.1